MVLCITPTVFTDILPRKGGRFPVMTVTHQGSRLRHVLKMARQRFYVLPCPYTCNYHLTPKKPTGSSVDGKT